MALVYYSLIKCTIGSKFIYLSQPLDNIKISGNNYFNELFTNGVWRWRHLYFSITLYDPQHHTYMIIVKKNIFKTVIFWIISATTSICDGIPGRKNPYMNRTLGSKVTTKTRYKSPTRWFYMGSSWWHMRRIFSRL